jgi:uncharacterized protein YeaO (DUF488 family)
MAKVQIKRIYEPAEKADGKRILIDRLWPRGIKKESAHIDECLKEVAPSTELRQWFHQSNDPAKWPEFEAKYLLELKQNDAVKDLQNIISKNPKTTLLYASRDEKHNHALVLIQFINGLQQ